MDTEAVNLLAVALCSNNKLRSIYMSDVGLDKQCGAVLSQVCHNVCHNDIQIVVNRRNLRVFDLSQNWLLPKVSEAIFIELGPALALSSLVDIDISGNELGEEGGASCCVLL